MPRYIPRRKLIEEMKLRQKKREQWQSKISHLKQTLSSIPVAKITEHKHTDTQQPEPAQTLDKQAPPLQKQPKTPNLQKPAPFKSAKTKRSETAPTKERGEQTLPDPAQPIIQKHFQVPNPLVIGNLLQQIVAAPTRAVCARFNTLLPTHLPLVAWRTYLKISNITSQRLWSLRVYALAGILLLCTASNLWHASKTIQYTASHPTLRTINLYPTLPGSWTELSLLYFEHNQEWLSAKALDRSERLMRTLQPLTGFLYGQQVHRTSTLLETPQKRREQLNKLNELLNRYPFSWQLLATKAWYEKELYLDEKCASTTTQIEWLYPQITLTSKD